jgi:hypothetical protein
VDPTPEERRIDEKAAALAGCELIDFLLGFRLREHWQENARRDLEEGRRLANELKAYPPPERRFWVEGAPDYQHWALAFVLCEDSEAAAPHDPEKALELAELALFVGRKEEALTKLEQVRHEFGVRGNPFDYALATLDAALLYRQEGRFPEIKVVAAEILDIFKAQNVHREALAAVMLFQEAAEKETLTTEMVRRLKDYLAKARNSPGLRF